MGGILSLTPSVPTCWACVPFCDGLRDVRIMCAPDGAVAGNPKRLCRGDLQALATAVNGSRWLR